MVLAFGLTIAVLAVLIGLACTFGGNGGSVELHVERMTMRELRIMARPDPLATLTVEWLADPRPAWETVEAFERSVEATLQGRQPARGDRPSVVGHVHDSWGDGGRCSICGWMIRP